MKKLLHLFIILFTITSVFGQTDPIDDDEIVNLDSIFPSSVMASPDPCIAPVVSDVAIVQFKTYAEAQVTLFPVGLSQTVSYRELGTTESYLTAPVTDGGRAILYGLGKNKTFEIAVPNACGILTTIGIVNTDSEFEGIVTVSESLHSELKRYLNEESSQKLTNYLRDLSSIPLFERVSFIQRFFFKGEPFVDGAPLFIPEIKIPTFCFCNTLITTQFAIPANLHFLTSGSGNVEQYTQPSSGGATGDNLGRNARSWEWLDNKGPAKYHQAWTEGFKAKYGVDHADSLTWQQASNGIGAQKSYIRVTLICLDGDEVPADCACEKNIEFAYKYDTRVTAHAHLVTGANGSKKAWAAAEDMYTVIFEDESKPLDARYEVLDMGITRAASACDWSVNPAFWTNMTSLLADGAILYLAYTATQNTQGGQQPSQTQQNALTSAITSFASTLGSVLTTPYGSSTGCGNDDDKFGSVEMQSFPTTFKPNATVTLTMSSFDRIASGGRRAWHAHGRILSGHFLTGVVKHDAYNGAPVHCCTPKVGMWMVGHCGGSATEDMLKREAADLLYHNQITNLIQTPAGISVVNDFGYTVQQSSVDACNQIVVNPTVSGGRSTETEPIFETSSTDVQIYDTQGKLLRAVTWPSNFIGQDLVTLRNNNSDLPIGLYFVVTQNKSGNPTSNYLFTKNEHTPTLGL